MNFQSPSEHLQKEDKIKQIHQLLHTIPHVFGFSKQPDYIKYFGTTAMNSITAKVERILNNATATIWTI